MTDLPGNMPAELERAIRRDERATIRRALESDDLRRAMRVMADRLTDLDRDERQAAAQAIPASARAAIRRYLQPNMRNLCLLLATLVEPIDRPDGAPDPVLAWFDRLQQMPIRTRDEAKAYVDLAATDPRKAS